LGERRHLKATVKHVIFGLVCEGRRKKCNFAQNVGRDLCCGTSLKITEKETESMEMNLFGTILV
jgi:hypothetical protein